MEKVINSINNVFENGCNNPDSSIIKIMKYKELSKLKIDNWRFNRPPDDTRFDGIKKYILEQGYVDGVIYLVNNNGILLCYDGIHRLSVLNIINSSGIDIDNYNITIHYYPVYNEQYIVNKFINLNKSIPIPALYDYHTIDRNLKTIVENFSKKLKSKYKVFKPSRNPQVPYVNRDKLMDNVLSIIKELNLNFSITINDLEKYFDNFNEYMKNNNNLTNTIKEKCEKHNNCFMFSDKNWNLKFIDFYNINIKAQPKIKIKIKQSNKVARI